MIQQFRIQMNRTNGNFPAKLKYNYRRTALTELSVRAVVIKPKVSLESVGSI